MSNLATSQPRSVAKINSKTEQPSSEANCERFREEDNDNCCFVYFFRLYCSQCRCSGCCHNEKQQRWRPQRRGANNYTSDTMFNEDIYITNGFLNDEGLITNGFLNDENPFTNKYSNNEQSLIQEYCGTTDHSKNYAEDEGLLHNNNEGRSRGGNNCGEFSEGKSQLGTKGVHSGAVGHTLVHSEDGGYSRNNNDSEGHCRSEGHTGGHSGGHSRTIHTIATGGHSEDGNHLVSGGHFNSGSHSGFNPGGHCDAEDYSSGYGGGNTTIGDCAVNDTGGDNGGGDTSGDCGGGDTGGDCGGGDTGGDCGGGDTGGGGGDD